jgi:outer membrane protein TolC
VRRSLLDLYGARESRQLLLEQQALRADSVRILEGQYAAGTISAFELTQARLAADSAALALSDARRREAEARAQLAGAIGIPDRALENASLVFDQFTSLPAGFDADAARQDALLNRSDVLAALAEYAASQALLQLEIARQYPDVQLGPGYEYDQGDNKWSLGVSLSLPADRNRGPIAEAQARREEAAARFNAVQAGVLAEIDLAVAAWRAASATREESNAMLGELTRQQQTAEGMLAAGAISGAELAALKVQTSAAALVRLDALLEAQRALGQLQDAVQRPLGLPDAVWEQSPRRFADTGEDSNR